MKKNFFFMAALLVAMVGCNKEPQEEGNGLSASDKVYMSFSIKTPTTRSATDGSGDTNSNANPDYEVGKDYENTIKWVDIVLTNDNSYILEKGVTPTGVIDNKYIAAFNSLDLEANAEYDVYIYANCHAPESKDLHATSNAAIEDMTKENEFWMTSAYEAKSVTLPANMSIYTSPSSPLNLGVHPVERSMARIDIAPYKEYEFKIGDTEMYVTLNAATIINHSKEFYQLRRVSNDGTNTDWTVGGVETPNNYVVDVDYEEKSSGFKLQEMKTALENGELFTSHMMWPEEFMWWGLPDPSGNDDGWNGNDKKYKIWQYCKENTIPGTTNQQKGITTAVVFRGEISSTSTRMNAYMNAKENLYMFENVLYGNWRAVTDAAAREDAPVTLKEAVAKVIREGLNDEYLDAPESVELLRECGFTGFSCNNDGKYSTYYYYWIRHNDNGIKGEMGNMEFAVVRNNVYKLCVDNIYKLGHPDPGNPDPDPESPEDPDESLNYYFNVTVDVLPWTVRVNNIEF